MGENNQSVKQPTRVSRIAKKNCLDFSIDTVAFTDRSLAMLQRHGMPWLPVRRRSSNAEAEYLAPPNAAATFLIIIWLYYNLLTRCCKWFPAACRRGPRDDRHHHRRPAALHQRAPGSEGPGAGGAAGGVYELGFPLSFILPWLAFTASVAPCCRLSLSSIYTTMPCGTPFDISTYTIPTSNHPLQEVLAGRPPAYEDLPRLPYLAQCAKETMRLYPAIPVFPREARADDTLPSGHAIRAGRRLSCHMRGCNFDLQCTSILRQGRCTKAWLAMERRVS